MATWKNHDFILKVYLISTGYKKNILSIKKAKESSIFCLCGFSSHCWIFPKSMITGVGIRMSEIEGGKILFELLSLFEINIIFSQPRVIG